MAGKISKILYAFFRLLLLFLHLVYSVLEYFDTAWALFKRKLHYIYLRSDSRLYVSHFVKSLKKCPKHVAIITGTERIYHEDFSNLIEWSLVAGISHISFYDYSGFMKDNEEIYFRYLLDTKNLDQSYMILHNRKINLINSSYKNGFNKKIHVNIMCQEDCKQLFRKLVENLCKKALSNEINCEEIDESFIDDELCKMIGVGEPELAIISGNVCSTFGYLPWHLRLTEFLQVPIIRNMTVTDFTSMLLKYSSCCQRFGT